MALPGKLCIGILEEDNPLKSYFRFKPLLVETEGKYEPFTGGQNYPDDGCTRIVPDKNESSHFKARMRRTGLFSVVDLTAHPNENDKIRPNKNYHGDGNETNAFIIYSDVVREPAPGLIYEIVDAGLEDGIIPRPHTPCVLLKKADGVQPMIFGWESLATDETGEEEDKVRLAAEGEPCSLDEMQIFEIPGFREETLHFAVNPAAMKAQAVIEDKEAPAQEEAPVIKEEAPAEVAPPADKPWIFHDASMLPKPVDPHLSPMQQILAAQAGLNPRRGRSLQELIEDKWQYSRMNQLGHPIAPVITGEPVANPVEQAVEAVRSAWKNPDMRTPLLKSLSAIEEFGISLNECREIIRASVIEKQLNDLEAQRLAILGEMEHLRQGRDALRSQLKQEIRKDEAEAFAEAVQKTKLAQAEQAKYEKQAQAARDAAKSAQEALDALSDGKLEKRLAEFAANSRLLEQLDRMKQKSISEQAKPAVEYESIDLKALAGRIQDRFNLEGWNMDTVQAANLAACIAISPATIFSGPAGSGKTAAPRLLAEALGWTDIGQYAAFGPGRKPVSEDARFIALGDDPALILLDDANTGCGDPFRGLYPDSARRICLGIQDAGAPVAANILDKGFTIRLARPDCDAPWQPVPACPGAKLAPASLERISGQLRALAAESLPASISESMAGLRRTLGEFGVSLSRRALDDAWYYCAAMIHILGKKANPAEIYDLAVAQRILPALLAGAPIEALARISEIIKGMPACQAILAQPLPVLI